MHFIKGNRTYVCLLIGIIAAVLTLTSAQDEPKIIKCIQCNSNEKPDCLDATKIEATVCASADFTKCYTKNDAGVITRGCLKSDDVATCASNCKICTTPDGCNKHIVCKKCATDDATCSQSDVSDPKYNDICDDSATKCIATVTDKKVERRCATAQDTCPNDTTCKLCTGSNCNVGIFPTQRIRCYQCSGSECSDVTSKASLSTPCRNYIDKDACYMLGDNSDSIKRGCKSDDATPCSAGTEESCATCAKDNCNNLPYKKDQTLKCIQCTGTDCFKEQQQSEAKKCDQQILYNQTESCYTLVKDGSIQRGCLLDDAKIAEECGKSDSTCKKCNSADGCNNAVELNPFTCIVCRSDKDSNCWDNADKLHGEKCRTGESSETDGCFHGIWYGVAIRGCYIDADERMQVVCQDKDNRQCTLCHTANCNKEKTSSGASSVTMYIGLLVMMITTTWYLK